LFKPTLLKQPSTGRIMEKLCVDSVADLVRLAEKAGIKPAD
jgi:hypothetical protein